ncbi:MAG: dihydrofolate reductase family protein [Acidimicrobiaceae bacterium]|nr:dihydrofolate reductase family protein [Acidimicrobiaceae bacterium]
MGKLVYSAIASLDGFVSDEDGSFDWAFPDEDLFRYVNDLERPAGTYLYGRRMYETMASWDQPPAAGESEVSREFRELWQAADKVVYSTTLGQASSRRTRIEPVFDPNAVLALKASADRELNVGGPTLAAQAFAAGLVDECHLMLHPIVVGGGNPALPRGVRSRLELLREGRFASGVVHLHYRVR